MAYADCGEGDESTGMNKMEYIPAVFYEEEIERVNGSKFIIQSWTCLDADTWGYIAGLNKVTHFYRIPILPEPQLNTKSLAMDNSVMQKIIDLQTEITKRDDLIAKLEVFIMLESKKRKGLMDAFYQEFKDTDIFLKRQPKK